MAEMRRTAQQQAVVENRGGTLLVSAAAGSGKTKVLVDRVVARIRDEGRNINEFLIITFTNAAAAELRGKISAALGAALAREPGNRHLRRQMNLLHLAQISTVHAFCGALIRQYGYLLEIPPDYAMLEDARREELLDRLLDRMLEERYDQGDADFLALADTLGAGRSDAGLAELVKALFEKVLSQPKPEEWLQSLPLTLEEGTELTGTIYGRILVENARTQLERLLRRYDWAIGLMEGDEKLEAKYLPAYIQNRADIAGMLQAMDGPWDSLGAALQMDYPRVSAQKYPDQTRLGAIKRVREDTKKCLETLRRQLSRPAAELIAEQNAMAPALSALAELVWELYRRFSKEKRRKNLLDFSDQEHLAISLLVGEDGRPTPVAREVSARYAEIMVDEYQDSNRVQELIYTAIARGTDENRFLVGDVKQSIYGFRQAEPELFLEKYQRYVSGETAEAGAPRTLILSKNFRSRPEILEAVNHTFAAVMRPEVGGLVYGPDQMLYPGLESYPADGECHVSLDVLEFPRATEGRDDDSTKYQREAAFAAGKIVSLLNRGLPVRDGETLRPVRPGDIAILLRSRDPMTTYQRALEQAGVPVSAEAGTALFETQEVQVLLNLLRVLDNPHQDVPLLAVLCCPLFRLSNDQLGRIRAASREERFYDALRACGEEFSQEALSRLEALRERAQTMSAEKLVWYLLEQTGLMAAYCAMENGDARRENLLSFYDICRETAGGGYLYLYELLRELERKAQSGAEGSAQPASGVTITTIHKSKGLEYPVVFLCDLSRKFNFRELSDNLLVDSELGLGARITDTEHRIRYPGLLFEALRVKKRKALLAEELRVLYVAMTRPKDYLFMTFAAAEGDSTLQRLLPGAGQPAETWAAAGAACLGDWVLLAALSRVEAGALFEAAGRPACTLAVSDYPWKISRRELQNVEIPRYRGDAAQDGGEREIPSPEGLIRSLRWVYPHLAESRVPSKLTATELKGRAKDQEAQEDAPAHVSAPRLLRPEFILERQGLTPQEKGTAAHLFLQYARFPGLDTLDGVIAELDRLVDGEYLTEQQADAVVPEEVVTLFSSSLGRRMLEAPELIREFKFSILTPAETYYPGLRGEKVLLQGVVDAAILAPEGITVIDFKTDRVDEAGAVLRAETYRGQLQTYREALGRIFSRPVTETILYFLRPGKEVRL